MGAAAEGKSPSTVSLIGGALTFAHVVAVARDGARVSLADAARPGIEAARKVVEQTAKGKEPAYGINTGFGSLAQKRIAPDDVRLVQRNLIESHSAGVGEPLPVEVVRAMMVILAASLARGHSGARVELIELICDVLNAGIAPVVPSRGSVGASGDLAPLAHAARVLIGEGEAIVDGKMMSAADALKAKKLSPIVLEAKEGLALINGTHLMCAIGTLALHDIELLQSAALKAGAMAIDACRATDSFLDARLHEARNQNGQQKVAAELRELLSGSKIVTSHLENDPRVQDPYSLRAMPQVLGAVWDAIEYARGVFERELAGVTDNPLVFADNSKQFSIVSGGNFHGAPLAVAMDLLKIALSHLAGIAERRVYWILAASDSENPVNVYLSPQPGLHSGLMIVQYTAAACCNELQTLATPASVANIPTSAGMEDYNSFGATSAHQLARSVELARHVIAIELLVMAEAMEYHRPLKSGAGVEKAYELVRGVVLKLTEDRAPSPDIAAIEGLIGAGKL